MPSTIDRRLLTARSPGEARLVRETPVSAVYGLSADVRPPMGEDARRTLETRIEAVLSGAPLTPAELDYWLRLVKWAATTGRDAAAEDALEELVESPDLALPDTHPQQPPTSEEPPPRAAEG